MDSTNQVFGITYWRLLTGVIVLAGACIAAGIAYGDITSRLSSLECQVQMLVDVVVYKAEPTQPRCK